MLSEEAADDSGRLTSTRVWIIDPLDGTREYSEPPRDDWAVHVALWADGDLSVGAVACLHSGAPMTRVNRRRFQPAHRLVRASRLAEPGRRRLSKRSLRKWTRSSCLWVLPERRSSPSLRDVTDAYVHAGGPYEWDSAAPVAHPWPSLGQRACTRAAPPVSSWHTTVLTLCCPTCSYAVQSWPARSLTSSRLLGAGRLSTRSRLGHRLRFHRSRKNTSSS